MKTRISAVIVLIGVSIAMAIAPAHSADGVTGSTSPQAVIEWSRTAHETIAPRKAPFDAAVFMGIVHVAIYDAVVAIEGGSEPYAAQPAVPAGASPEVAAATAAYRMLVALFPDAQATLDAKYSTFLAGVPDGPAEEGGKSVGESAAAWILSLRRGDGRNAVVPYVQPPVGPGVFEPTNSGSPVGTHVGQIRPLTLPSPSYFRPGPPPALTSERYAQDLNEVKARGRRTGATRSRIETYTAHFWNDHGVAQWNRALLRLIVDSGLDLRGAARLLAMAHAAGADGMIACFDTKYHYMFWRPIHAIPRADTDGNPLTVADPTWESLLATPNHPEYPAAHSCHSAAVGTAVAAFFGTEHVTLTIDSMVTGETRTFASVSEALNQVIEARILGGIHFRFSGQAGTVLGTQVALHAATRFELV